MITTSLQMQSYLPPSCKDYNKIERIQAILPEIDSMYQAYAEKNHSPGYAYGIIVDGQLISTGTGGFTDLDKKIPVTSQSMFRIASMTKSFTAMATLKLRDENKLKLDDPVYLYIPEIQNQKLTEDAPDITIRDLLTHSAGFSTDDPWADRKLNEMPEELMTLLKKGIYFSNVSGTAYEYSNLGYTMLGYIIQKITDIPYQKFILESMCQPLGMETFWEFSEVPSSRLVQGYSWKEGAWKKEPLIHDGIFGAMGGMIASIESFSQYVALHLSAWPSRNDKEIGPIKRSSIREMHQPWRFKELLIDKYPDKHDYVSTNAYGYGLCWSRDNQGRVFVGHAGGLPGFGSNWFIMPDYGLGVISFANVTYAPATKVNFEVLDKIIGAAQLKPKELPSSTILKQRQHELVKLLPHWENADKSGFFADNFFLDQSIDSLKKETVEFFVKAGKILSIGEVIPENQLRGDFIIEGEMMDLHIKFALTPENPPLIQEYHIKEMEKKIHPNSKVVTP